MRGEKPQFRQLNSTELAGWTVYIMGQDPQGDWLWNINQCLKRLNLDALAHSDKPS